MNVGEVKFGEREASRAYERMVARRDAGLKTSGGAISFDLGLLQASLQTQDQGIALGILATVAFVVLAGMLIAIERRNREDRRVYLKILGEPFLHTVRRSWASTWPLLGAFALTIAIWVMAN